MTSLLQALSHRPTGPATSRDVANALTCLNRFIAAFNRLDIHAMDAELHFPHVMITGSTVLTWQQPGQHPAGFFDELRATGWQRTRLDLHTPVLTSAEKIHFLISYARLNGDSKVISTHANLWVLMRSSLGWKIAVRSY